ncbi:MAG: carboxypeptidase-like regulatory domain-containing protein, partial [Calditrichaeota bacterium]
MLLKIPSKWFVLLTLFLVPLAMQAGETGKISGRVIDKESGEPLPGANVVIVGTSMGSATNLEGDFYIVNIPPGKYDVRASFIGYKTEIQTEVVVWIDKTVRIDFQLEVSALEMQEVNVVAYRPDEVEKDVTATKLSYDIERLDELPGISDITDCSICRQMWITATFEA